jgi:hypothetical protein
MSNVFVRVNLMIEVPPDRRELPGVVMSRLREILDEEPDYEFATRLEIHDA